MYYVYHDAVRDCARACITATCFNVFLQILVTCL